MAEFQFDTSGAVAIVDTWQPNNPNPGKPGFLYWSDLSPFVQGYVGALCADVKGFHDPHYLKWDEATNCRTVRFVAFRDLAPETLARIMEDCARIHARPISATHNWGSNELAGKMFWRDRASGFAGLGLEPRIRYSEVFPPLTLSLNDAGQVIFKETSK